MKSAKSKFKSIKADAPFYVAAAAMAANVALIGYCIVSPTKK